MEISKIKLALKWLFGGPEAVVDYVLAVLNSFLAQDNVAAKVKRGHEIAVTVLTWLSRFESWCPQKWQNEYNATAVAVAACVNAFEDGKVTQEELAVVTAQFKAAYAMWTSEDDDCENCKPKES